MRGGLLRGCPGGGDGVGCRCVGWGGVVFVVGLRVGLERVNVKAKP